MMYSLSYKVLFAWVLMSLGVTVSAQIKATTPDGRVVILNNDGTWVFEDGGTMDDLADLCAYRINQVDPNNGSVKKFTKIESIANDKDHVLKVSVRRDNDRKYMVAIYSGDLGCINKESTILIKLLSGQVVSLKNTSEAGCEAGETMLIDLDSDSINKLMGSQFSRIRVTGSDFFADLSPKYPSYFVEKLKCIE